MIAFCRDKRRRDRVLQIADLNGIDYLEVPGAAGCGTRLALTFLKDPSGLHLTPSNFAISGDTKPNITSIESSTTKDPNTLTLVLDSTGDFSPYTLTIVTRAKDPATGEENPDPPPGIDPQLASIDFSFKAGCTTPADCLQTGCCAAPALPAPDIHYLARDYDGFRQAMLDRMAALVPDWTETHGADPGITMIEALAYAADRVSYLQDAVNTEAYIGTARSRISLRRHARLIDYKVQDGANARTWVCLSAARDNVTVPAGTQIYSLVPGLGPSVEPGSNAAARLQASPGPVFQSLTDLTVWVEQNRMEFYTWGDGQCCLPAGATEATLNGSFESLRPGAILIFEEMVGPNTGNPGDADPTHRWAVRLTAADTRDHSGNPLVDPAILDPVTHQPVAITRIAWQSADALPFSLCLSSVTDAAHDSTALSGVSVARGNILPADHGLWIQNESLGTVPALPPEPVSGIGCNCDATAGAATPQPFFRPKLLNQPLTFAVPFDTYAPASTFLAPDTTSAAAQISLGSDDGLQWAPVEDLLEEESEFNGFIPEIEFDNTAHLRFGDDVYGSAPKPGVSFTATYRVGNGTAGNVGREALAHILFAGPAVSGVRNPLAAAGGTDPETMEHIRQVAPYRFRTQLRCVTAQDYGDQASEIAGVGAARGTMRWTGSWYTAFVSVQPGSDQPVAVTSSLAKSVTRELNKLRMMGVDLAVEAAHLVGLRIGLAICVAPDYFEGDVYSALWKVLVSGDSCTGTRGLLDPANFQFGETVYSSRIVQAAQSVTGVASVNVVTFERMDSPTPVGTLPPNRLNMGPLEIPRCDNDSNHADRGLLILSLDGGK
ncbi:putative baseplate assembly protein [Acidobacteria bacterium AB60]|nr:putative baseplate assembly protein [Acidobacteria bacterium AB60]